MKKSVWTFLVLFALVVLTATSALAFKTGGEFGADKYSTGNINRYTTAFSPSGSTTVTLNQKTFTNIDVSSYQAFKVFFTKVTDGTISAAGLMKIGGFTTSWSESGTVPVTVYGDVYNIGKNVATVGFAPYSTTVANRVNVNILYQ